MGNAHRIVLAEEPARVLAFFRREPQRIDEKLDGQTPLMLRLDSGRTGIARVLIDLGANVHLTDRHGDGALMKAARKGMADVTKLLLSLGVDVNATDAVDGLSAMDWALLGKHEDVANILRQAGGRPFLCDDKSAGV
jgi:ankyrin repeat protein